MYYFKRSEKLSIINQINHLISIINNGFITLFLLSIIILINILNIDPYYLLSNIY